MHCCKYILHVLYSKDYRAEQAELQSRTSTVLGFHTLLKSRVISVNGNNLANEINIQRDDIQRDDELARIRQEQIEIAARTAAKLQELLDLREMVRLAREANQ